MGILSAFLIMGLAAPFVLLYYGDFHPIRCWNASNWSPKIKEFFNID
jgi:hypothetical protein